MLLRRARTAGAVVDVLSSTAVVADRAGLPAPAGAEVVDLDGRALLPGLWDAHVHFDQWTLARRRLDLGPAGSAAEATALVAARLRADPPEPGTALVGHGFRDALWPDAPHRDLLDPVTGDVPVVLVAADLHCCWLNSAAAARYGMADHPTGLVRERDWMPIMTDVGGAGRAARPLVRRDGPGGGRARGGRDRRLRGAVAARRVGRADRRRRGRAAGGGVGVARGARPADGPIARGLRSGDVVPGTDGLLTMGPLKVVTDGSLNTRTACCDDPYPGLRPARTRAACCWWGRTSCCPCCTGPPGRDRRAVHAIGDRANALVLDAFAALTRAGAAGGSSTPSCCATSTRPGSPRSAWWPACSPPTRSTTATSPTGYWAGRTGRAFPYRSLLDAGAELVLGSDAPVAPLDPWITIAAAVHRSGDDRPDVAPGAGDPAAGRAGRVDGPRRPDRGRAARRPVRHRPRSGRGAGADRLSTMPVAGTLLGGRWTHRAGI